MCCQGKEHNRQTVDNNNGLGLFYIRVIIKDLSDKVKIKQRPEVRE